jgi:hypothetical protein
MMMDRTSNLKISQSNNFDNKTITYYYTGNVCDFVEFFCPDIFYKEYIKNIN